MASVNGDIKMLLTYLKTFPLAEISFPFPLGNGPFYLKISWRVQRARMLGAVPQHKSDADNEFAGLSASFSQENTDRDTDIDRGD